MQVRGKENTHSDMGQCRDTLVRSLVRFTYWPTSSSATPGTSSKLAKPKRRCYFLFSCICLQIYSCCCCCQINNIAPAIVKACSRESHFFLFCHYYYYSFFKKNKLLPFLFEQKKTRRRKTFLVNFTNNKNKLHQ